MCEFKTERIIKLALFISISKTGQAKSHKCFLSVKKYSHRKLLQLLNHVQAHAVNPQVPGKTSTEKASLQLSKVCLALTFLLSKTWHIKQCSHTTLKQNEAKIWPVLTDALNQILLLSVCCSLPLRLQRWNDRCAGCREIHREQCRGRHMPEVANVLHQ